jgi:hypothetical protein
MAAGITAGTVAASAPVIYGVVRNMMPRPLGEHDYLHTENGCFYTRDGAMLCLRGLNLNDELFFFKKDGMDLPATNYDIFDAFEERFGRYMKQSLHTHRDELFIATKAGHLMWPGPYGDWGSRKSLMASLDQSLRRMQLEYVDIYYSHRYDPNTPLEETMQALVDIVRSGKALYVGLSKYPEPVAREAYAYLADMIL